MLRTIADGEPLVFNVPSEVASDDRPAIWYRLDLGQLRGVIAPRTRVIDLLPTALAERYKGMPD